MVAADESPTAQVDPTARVERRRLTRLPMGDDIGAQVFPIDSGRAEPCSQLLDHPTRQAGLEGLGPRDGCGHQAAAGRRVGRGHLAQDGEVADRTAARALEGQRGSLKRRGRSGEPATGRGTGAGVGDHRSEEPVGLGTICGHDDGPRRQYFAALEHDHGPFQPLDPGSEADRAMG